MDEVQNQYGGFNVNPLDLTNSVIQSDIKMAELQKFIREKSFDSVTNTPKTQAADTVYEVAQKYLGNLVQNIYIVTNPAAAKSTVTGLQSMKVAISQQRIQDTREASLCRAFLNIVESNPLFIAAKPYLDQLLNDLGQTPVGGGIARQILTGDLSGIIGILEGYHLVNNTVTLINCENNETGNNIDPAILGLSPEVTTESMQQIERTMSQLRDSQAMALDTMPSIIEQVEQIET